MSRPSSGERGYAKWLAALVLAGGLFLAVLSTTAVSVALPRIGQDLNADSSAQQWIVDSYVIVYASLLLPGGVLGDRRGRKGLFLLGIAIFALGSLVSGAAPSVSALLAGRVLQGLGPALLVPGSLTIVRATFEDPRSRAIAIGLWTTSAGLAMALGPALGGLLVDTAGWRWVFWFNVPLAGLLLAAAAKLIPLQPRTPVTTRFDWGGALLSVASVALLVFAVIEGQTWGWAAPIVIACAAVGLAAAGWFVRWERRRPDPLVDVGLFAQPAFTGACVSAFVIFFAFVGAIVYLSAYFQLVLGDSPVDAGLATSTIGISLAVVALASGRLVGRFGEYGPLVIGLAGGGFAMLGLLRLATDGPDAVWWNLALLGAGIGLCGTPISAIAMSAVDSSRAGMASAVINAMRQLGQVFGVAVLGALVYADPSIHPGTGRLSPSQAGHFVDGLHHALTVSGVALIATAMLAAVLTRPRRTPRSEEPTRAGAETI